MADTVRFDGDSTPLVNALERLISALDKTSAAFEKTKRSSKTIEAATKGATSSIETTAAASADAASKVSLYGTALEKAAKKAQSVFSGAQQVSEQIRKQASGYESLTQSAGRASAVLSNTGKSVQDLLSGFDSTTQAVKRQATAYDELAASASRASAVLPKTNQDIGALLTGGERGQPAPSIPGGLTARAAAASQPAPSIPAFKLSAEQEESRRQLEQFAANYKATTDQISASIETTVAGLRKLRGNANAFEELRNKADAFKRGIDASTVVAINEFTELGVRLDQTVSRLRAVREGAVLAGNALATASGNFLGLQSGKSPIVGSGNADISKLLSGATGAAAAPNPFLTGGADFDSGKVAQFTSNVRDAGAEAQRLLSGTAAVNESLNRIPTERVAAAKKELERATSAGQVLNQTVRAIGQSIIFSFAFRAIDGFISGVREATGTAIDLSRALAEVQTIDPGRTLGTFEGLRDTLVDISNEFGTDILDEAEAAYQVLSNQVAEGAEAFRFLEASNRFAVAAVTDTSTAVNLLTAAINAYGLEAADADVVGASFFKTIELGRIRAEELSDTLGRIAVPAGNLGISLQELESALATITIRGVKANEASTLLRGIIQKLTRPTEKLKDVFRDLGFANGEAAQQALGFGGVLQEIEKVTGGTSTELGEIFNRIRAVTGAAVFSGKGLEDYRKNLEQIQNIDLGTYEQTIEGVLTNTGVTVQREANRLRNFFTVELGQRVVEAIAAVSAEFGGIENVIERVVNVIGDVGKAVGILTALYVANTVVVKANAAGTLAAAAAQEAQAAATLEVAAAQNIALGTGETWKVLLGNLSLATTTFASAVTKAVFSVGGLATIIGGGIFLAIQSIASDIEENSRQIIANVEQQDRALQEIQNRSAAAGTQTVNVFNAALNEAAKEGFKAAADFLAELNKTQDKQVEIADKLEDSIKRTRTDALNQVKGVFRELDNETDKLQKNIAAVDETIEALRLRAGRVDFEIAIEGNDVSLFDFAGTQLDQVDNRIASLKQLADDKIQLFDIAALNKVNAELGRLFDQRDKLVQESGKRQVGTARQLLALQESLGQDPAKTDREIRDRIRAEERALQRISQIQEDTPDQDLAAARIEVEKIRQEFNQAGSFIPLDKVQELSDKLLIARKNEQAILDVIAKRREARKAEAAEAERQADQLRQRQAEAQREAERQQLEATRRAALGALFEEAVKNAGEFNISDLFDLKSAEDVSNALKLEFDKLNRVAEFGDLLGVDTSALRIAEQVSKIREAGATRVAQIEQDAARKRFTEQTEELKARRKAIEEDLTASAETQRQLLALATGAGVANAQNSTSAARQVSNSSLAGTQQGRNLVTALSTFGDDVRAVGSVLTQLSDGKISANVATSLLSPIRDNLAAIFDPSVSGTLRGQLLSNLDGQGQDQIRLLFNGLQTLLDPSQQNSIAQIEKSKELVRSFDDLIKRNAEAVLANEKNNEKLDDASKKQQTVNEKLQETIDLLNVRDRDLQLGIADADINRQGLRNVPEFERIGIDTGTEIQSRMEEGGRVAGESIREALASGGAAAGKNLVDAQVERTRQLQEEAEAAAQAQREAAAKQLDLERRRVLQFGADDTSGAGQAAAAAALELARVGADTLRLINQGGNRILEPPTLLPNVEETRDAANAAIQARVQEAEVTREFNRSVIDGTEVQGNLFEATQRLQGTQETLTEAQRAYNETILRAAGASDAFIKSINSLRGRGTVPGFATGGLVTGTPGIDNILARVSHGEFVVNSQATRQNLPLLRAINSHSVRSLQGYNNGGLVQVGGIKVTVNESQNPQATARVVAAEINRGIRQGTIKLRNS